MWWLVEKMSCETRKRKAEDIELDVNEICVPSEHTTIHGVMTEQLNAVAKIPR